MKRASAFVLFVLFATSHASAQTGVHLEPVLSGLSSPVYVTNAHDGTNRLFVVEQPGRILVLQPGATVPTVFLDIRSRVLAGGEQGLLGLAFHPLYATTRRFFVNYTRQGDGATVIAEYRASASDANVAEADEKVILVVPQPFANHNGGMIEFGLDGMFYIGMGDGGSANDPGNRAQNVEELLGKMLRIDVDRPNGSVPYSSPPDNPFFGATPGRDEIYATGFRNPYRWSFDRSTGTLWAGDVGQGMVEEIDLVRKGGNYGWRVFEGTRCTGLGPAPCTPANYVAPHAEYDHSGGRCSITGGYVYHGTRSTVPRGTYLFADFCTGEILMYQTVAAIETLLDTTLSISSFGEDEAKEIYVVDLNGAVYRLKNTNTPQPDSVNLARGGAATQSSTYTHSLRPVAARAVDGNTDGAFSNGSVTHTNSDAQAWWQVDLGSVQPIGEIKLWNRTDCCSERLADFHVFVSDSPFDSTNLATTQAQPGVADFHVAGQAGETSLFTVNRTGRYVRVQLTGFNVLSLAEVEIWSGRSPSSVTNWARGKAATQSSTYTHGISPVAARAVDGNTNGAFSGGSVTHTNSDAQAWWQVDLGSVQPIGEIKLWNRTDCCSERLSNFYILVSDEPFTSTDLSAAIGQPGVSSYHNGGAAPASFTQAVNRTGRYVRVQLAGTGVLSLAEVEVWSGEAPPVVTNWARGGAATQSSTYVHLNPIAARAVDGNTDGVFSNGSVTHTNNDAQAWWQVDLGGVRSIDDIKVWNRTDCCSARLSNFHVFVSDVPFTSTNLATTQAQPGVTDFHVAGQAGDWSLLTINRTGRYVRVQLTGTGILSLAEVEVRGEP